MNVFITGASSGFGRLCVPLLLERGHTVIAGLRGGETRAAEVLAAEKARWGDRLIAVDLHLEKPETFAAAQELVEARFGGRLDALVNNAGYGLFGAVEDVSSERLRNQFEVNFFGPMELVRVMLPALVKARGRILNVSSVVGRAMFPFYGPYAASKYALEAMTEELYYDLKPRGVRVCLIEPGAFKTDFNSRSLQIAGLEDSASPNHGRARGLLKFFRENTGRQGDPRRVARAIARLCEAERMPLRVPVGMDAHLLITVRRLFPDGLFVRAVDWVFRRVIFGERRK